MKAPTLPLICLCMSVSLCHAVEWIAHRGDHTQAPENSVPAAQAAWQAGARFVEGDFHLTKSGEVVCVHGPKELAALTGCDKAPAELTAADVAALDLNAKRPKDADGKAPAPVRVPTLAQMLATVPADGTFVIEVKTYGPGFAEKVRQAMTAARLRDDQVVFIAFDADALKDLREKLPQVRAFWIFKFKKKEGRLTPDVADAIATAKRAGANGVDMGAVQYLTADYVRALKDAGLTCWVWTVDDAAQAQQLKAMGIDGITTDRIAAFVKLDGPVARP